MISDSAGTDAACTGLSVLGDALDAATGGRLGVCLSFGFTSSEISGVGIAISLGKAVACGGGNIVALRLGGPGLIGRTGSKYCVSGGFVAVGAKGSSATLDSTLGNGVSAYVGIVALCSAEAGVSPAYGVGEGELLLCDLRGVGVAVGDGRVKSFFNLSPSVSFCS